MRDQSVLQTHSPDEIGHSVCDVEITVGVSPNGSRVLERRRSCLCTITRRLPRHPSTCDGGDDVRACRHHTNDVVELISKVQRAFQVSPHGDRSVQKRGCRWSAVTTEPFYARAGKRVDVPAAIADFANTVASTLGNKYVERIVAPHRSGFIQRGKLRIEPVSVGAFFAATRESGHSAAAKIHGIHLVGCSVSNEQIGNGAENSINTRSGIWIKRVDQSVSGGH